MKAIPMAEAIEAIQKMLEEGATLGTAIAIILAVLKLLEGRHNTKRNKHTNAELKAIKSDLESIKEALCIAPTYNPNLPHGQRKKGAWSLPHWGEPSRARYAKEYITLRRKNMSKSINWVTLVVALLGAAKIVLQAFGVDLITDDMIDLTSNIVAGIVTLVGVIMSHTKPKGEPIDAAISNSLERSE